MLKDRKACFHCVRVLFSEETRYIDGSMHLPVCREMNSGWKDDTARAVRASEPTQTRAGCRSVCKRDFIFPATKASVPWPYWHSLHPTAINWFAIEMVCQLYSDGLRFYSRVSGFLFSYILSLSLFISFCFLPGLRSFWCKLKSTRTRD